MRACRTSTSPCQQPPLPSFPLAELVVAEERGHSVSLRTASAGSGPLLSLLGTYGHLMGLHPLRRAVLRATVAFDCSERPPPGPPPAAAADANPVTDPITDPVAAAAPPPPRRRAIHTLTLEAEVESGPRADAQPPGSLRAALARLLDSAWPGAEERLPALRYVLAAPIVPATGWRVVSIDGAGGGDGCGPGAPSFSSLLGRGRALARPRTSADMRDDAEDEDIAEVRVVAEGVAASLDALTTRLAALRDAWCGREPGSEVRDATRPRLAALAPRAPSAGLNGLSVAEALGVVVRALGAAARAVGDVSDATAAGMPPWLARAQLEAAWEEVEAELGAGAPAASLVVHALLRTVAVRELRRLDCCAEAAALERAQEAEPCRLTRADLALISAALARADAAAATGGGPVGVQMSVGVAPAGARPPGTAPWELLCDRRRRVASRRAVVGGAWAEVVVVGGAALQPSIAVAPPPLPSPCQPLSSWGGRSTPAS